MRQRWLPTLIGVAALACVVALRIADPTPVTQVRNWVFDGYQRIEPRPYEPAGVRVIDIDETSLEAYGQWPWPRTVLATLVERLDTLGAAAIVFDMVFGEPDRTAPRFPEAPTSGRLELWERPRTGGPICGSFASARCGCARA
jgi:adenylate cyclase